MKKTIFAVIITLAFASTASAQHPGIIPADYDWCSNMEGIQNPVPSGYHAESDGTCTVLPPPVTIDVVAPGEEAQTTDFAAPGDEPVTVDMVQGGSSGGSSSQGSAVINPDAPALPSTSIETKKTITTVEEFKAATKPTKDIMIIIDTSPVQTSPAPQNSPAPVVPEETFDIQSEPENVQDDPVVETFVGEETSVTEESPSFISAIGNFFGNLFDSVFGWFRD